MTQLLAVAAGGAIGAAGRYLIYRIADRLAPAGLLAGTFIVNVVGCLVVGYVAGLELQRADAVAPGVRLFLVVGLCGGFTTFSAFGLETFALIRDGQMVSAGLNVTAQVIAGLAAVWGGMALSRVG